MLADTPTMMLSVNKVRKGGSFAAGERLFFDAELPSGDIARITIPTDTAGAFVEQVLAYADLAQTERPSAGSVLPSAPLNIRGIGVHPTTDGLSVILRAHIGPSVFLDVPIPTENVDQLAASLTKQAAIARQVRGQRH